MREQSRRREKKKQREEGCKGIQPVDDAVGLRVCAPCPEFPTSPRLRRMQN
jgi:hypothetical protein